MLTALSGSTELAEVLSKGETIERSWKRNAPLWFDKASTVSSAEPLTTPRKIEGRSNVLLLNCHKMKCVCNSAVPDSQIE